MFYGSIKLPHGMAYFLMYTQQAMGTEIVISIVKRARICQCFIEYNLQNLMYFLHLYPILFIADFNV